MSQAPTSNDTLVAVAVGNTRTRFGVFTGSELGSPRSMENADPSALVRAIAEEAGKLEDAVVVIASVNDEVADALEEGLRGELESPPMRIGRDIPIPLAHTLADASTLGQDRMLNALGASARARQACVVVDAGTAVTVDYVDAEGVFRGGLIAPGLNMMLQSLHEHTAALPLLRYERPGAESGPGGSDTASAMQLGVTTALRGLVRLAVETFAIRYEGYPQVVATGGDLGVLEEDDAIEHFVPDLQLIGIHTCCLGALADADDDE
jgi:type III pantothenate kinase